METDSSRGQQRGPARDGAVSDACARERHQQCTGRVYRYPPVEGASRFVPCACRCAHRGTGTAVKPPANAGKRYRTPPASPEVP